MTERGSISTRVREINTQKERAREREKEREKGSDKGRCIDKLSKTQKMGETEQRDGHKKISGRPDCKRASIRSIRFPFTLLSETLSN